MVDFQLSCQGNSIDNDRLSTSALQHLDICTKQCELPPYIQINSEWVMTLNVKPKTDIASRRKQKISPPWSTQRFFVCMSFIKFYFIDYAITVVPMFHLCPPPPSTPQLPPVTPKPLSMSMDQVSESIGCSIPRGSSVTVCTP